MRTLKRAFLLLILAVLGCCQGASESLVFITKSDGEILQVKVEVADTPESRSRGLMFRENLPEGTGMLFVFPTETLNSFWMKNTPIPLDIIFIKQGEIVSLIEDTTPYDETLLTPESSYTMTLEVPGGYAARHGVRLGDRFEWRPNGG